MNEQDGLTVAPTAHKEWRGRRDSPHRLTRARRRRDHRGSAQHGSWPRPRWAMRAPAALVAALDPLVHQLYYGVSYMMTEAHWGTVDRRHDDSGRDAMRPDHTGPSIGKSSSHVEVATTHQEGA